MAQPYVGEIRIFAASFAPAGWAFCHGQLLPISENETLFQLIGTTYGGDGESTFALPNLASRVPVHMGQGPGLQHYTLAEAAGLESVTLTTQQMPTHNHAFLASTAGGQSPNPENNVIASPPAVTAFIRDTPVAALSSNVVGPVGGSQPHENAVPYLTVNYIISLFGLFPSPDLMADPFVAEIRVVGFNFPPTGWAFCNGQLLPISQNTALFSLLGTFYGGDGKSTFALPNLQDSAAVCAGQGSGLSQYFLGQQGGSATVTLIQSEMPFHTHTPRATTDPAEVQAPAADRSLARSNPGFLYQSNDSANRVSMAPQTLAPSGGSLPHNNMSPFLALNYVIAMQGVYPPRS